MSVIKDVEEALVELLLPQLAFRGDSKNDQGLVWTGVDVEEFAILWLEVGLASPFRVVLGLIQLVSDCHVHLDLDSGQVHLIVLVTHHQVLVTVVPEEWMGLHLNDLVFRRGRVTLSVVLEPFKMVQLDGDD